MTNERGFVDAGIVGADAGVRGPSQMVASTVCRVNRCMRQLVLS